MEEPRWARDSLIGAPIEVEVENGACCQKCLVDDVQLDGADQDDFNTPSISPGEPVCVTASRRAENHPLGASSHYEIFDVFHPFHLVPGAEIEGEERGYHEVTLCTTAVTSNADETAVVIGDDPDIIYYSPPSAGADI